MAEEDIPLGVLLINLGTPEAPTPPAVRRYLCEMLSDPRVVEFPRLLWWPILHGFILRLRPRRAAPAYRSIWTDEGSPLLVVTKRQAIALETSLRSALGTGVMVSAGMRYGNPSIKAALDRLRACGIRRLLVLPLYPQYSSVTTGSAFDAAAAVLKTWRSLPELRVITGYHGHEHYIAALADSIALAWRCRDPGRKLLFSFHGLPQTYHRNGDPYYSQCLETARLVADRLGLDGDRWLVAFQSRFGPREWLRPYTDHTLLEWARQGIDHVDVVCPGFAAECLETLEEIDLRYRKAYLDAGGRQLHYIPALNDGAGHIMMLARLVQRHIQGWPEQRSS